MSVEELINESKWRIELIRDKVIGVFRMSGDNSTELVLRVDDYGNKDIKLRTIRISYLGGISETFGIPASKGTLKLFPDGVSMNQMMSNPFEFNRFIMDFNKQAEIRSGIEEFGDLSREEFEREEWERDN